MTDHDNQRDPRPGELDFDPYGGCLDAQCAWKNFGGFSIPDAYAKFCEHPFGYSEDFMFMGGVAFSYYFPVVERYILESHADAQDNEVEAIWILAHGIAGQFHAPCTDPIKSLRSRAFALDLHVRSNLPQYCLEPAEQRRVDAAWSELQIKLTATK